MTPPWTIKLDSECFLRAEIFFSSQDNYSLQTRLSTAAFVFKGELETMQSPLEIM
jgi:hypothetical protein